MSDRQWTTLGALLPGSIFETQDGVRALKTQYVVEDQARCVFLGGGQHVDYADDTRVRPVPVVPVARVTDDELELEPVHGWFELSYVQYLTIPRSILESMPTAWQQDLVDLLEQLDATFNWRPSDGRYWVRLKDGNGRFVRDELMNYRHPNYPYIDSLRQSRA